MEELPVIMVVEDDDAVQGFVEEALVDGGFEPAIAASGEEAVTLLMGRLTKYRALVTDINLRGSMPSAPAQLVTAVSQLLNAGTPPK